MAAFRNIHRLGIGIVAITMATSPACALSLLVNGGFEASSSTTQTPTGWNNIGPTNGVIPYSVVSAQPIYEGLNFYSLGGVGSNGLSAIGVGISQSVATTAGNTYRLTFGYSGENGPDLSTVLGVSIGSMATQFQVTSTNDGFFTRPFTTATIDYVATGALTTISFTLLATNEIGLIGNNDPLIDGVSFEQIATGMPAVPEPATWAMMIAGFTLTGSALRRRSMNCGPRGARRPA